MRLSELSGKMIVNLENGELLGNIGDADLLIDEMTGEIISILLPVRTTMFNRLFDKASVTIPWSAVKKVGAEIMVIEIANGAPPVW